MSFLLLVLCVRAPSTKRKFHAHVPNVWEFTQYPFRTARKTKIAIKSKQRFSIHLRSCRRSRRHPFRRHPVCVLSTHTHTPDELRGQPWVCKWATAFSGSTPTD